MTTREITPLRASESQVNRTMELTYSNHPKWLPGDLESMKTQLFNLQKVPEEDLSEEDLLNSVVARIDYLTETISLLEGLRG